MLNLLTIYEAINELAPWNTAESWDNSGLQVGRMDQPVRKILLAVDFNQAVFAEGCKLGVDGYLVHHPFFFKPLQKIDLADPKGSALANLIKHDQFLLSAHTNLDCAPYGINHYLANQLQLQEVRPLQPLADEYCKIAVFVPASQLDRLRWAMAEAGAGEIGAYTQCSFTTEGTGSFLPGKSANPHIGSVGELEFVSEVRLEMVLPRSQLGAVEAAIMKVHPYEKPAFDVYPLLISEVNPNNLTAGGLGRIGYLKPALTLDKFCQLLKRLFSVNPLRVSGDPRRLISKVALCSGNGKSLIPKVLKEQVDLYITADLDYHDFCDGVEAGLAMVDLGHYSSEHCFIPLMAEYLNQTFSENELQLISSTVSGEPYRVL